MAQNLISPPPNKSVEVTLPAISANSAWHAKIIDLLGTNTSPICWFVKFKPVDKEKLTHNNMCSYVHVNLSDSYEEDDDGDWRLRPEFTFTVDSDINANSVIAKINYR